MNINNLFIVIAMWLNGGCEPTSVDIKEAIALVTILVIIAIALIVFVAFILLSSPDAYMESPPFSLLLDIQDYDNDKYKIFLLRRHFGGYGGMEGDFYHLSEIIAKRFTFSDMKTESVCRISFAESNQDLSVQRRTVDNFNGVLFYDREKNKWLFYEKPPTIKLRFYNKDNAVHVDVKIAIIGSVVPDMPPHTNLDDLLSLLFINHNKNYTIHFLDIDNGFKRGRLENG